MSDMDSNDVAVAQRLASRFGWLGPTSSLGAFATSFWLLYRVFKADGLLLSIVAFVLLSICYMVGPAPMFAVAATILCFYFHAVGLWLPILSYVIAAGTLVVSLRMESLRKRDDPHNIGQM